MYNSICLFTAHSPLTGGGGAILRSLVKNLPKEYNIAWYYLADTPSVGHERGWLGPSIMGNSYGFADLSVTAGFLVGLLTRRLRNTLSVLQDLECDAYWVVSHNEGLVIAKYLAENSTRPVHLTIHDDWAGALCARSRRYQLLGKIANRATKLALKVVYSVDTVSEGMRRYYTSRIGVNSTVIHRFIPYQGPILCNIDSQTIKVGHLGSVYSRDSLFIFVNALKSYCQINNLKGKIILWGSHLNSGDIPKDLSGWIELKPASPEEAVILELSSCNFVYAMYPFETALSSFVQTSLPTKLTSYVLAQRPILAHTPYNSTLTKFIKDTSIGRLWTNLDPVIGSEVISSLLLDDLNDFNWQKARNLYFGDKNLLDMSSLLFRLISLKSNCA